MKTRQRAEIIEILDGAQYLTLATVRTDGYPQATTLSFVHDGLKIYFGCDLESQKVQNIRYRDKVSLTANLPYTSWTGIRGLSLAGRAHVVARQAEIRRVFETMASQFPQLDEYITEDSSPPQMGIVRIDPEVISLLDYRKGFGHKELITC